MEYIDGRNLAEVLAQFGKQDGAEPPDEILKYSQAIAVLLGYTHFSGDQLALSSRQPHGLR